MRAITILAIVAIVAALGAVTSLVPTQHVSAAGIIRGPPSSPPNPHAGAACFHAGEHPPFC